MRLPFPLSALVLAVPVLATGARSEQLPPMLQDLAGQDMAACREGGGDPILGPDYASSADLNGDGVPDYLINLDTRINARSSRGVRMISGAAAGLAAYPATSP